MGRGFPGLFLSLFLEACSCSEPGSYKHIRQNPPDSNLSHKPRTAGSTSSRWKGTPSRDEHFLSCASPRAVTNAAFICPDGCMEELWLLGANSPCGEGGARSVQALCLQKVKITGASIPGHDGFFKQSSPKHKYIVFYRMHSGIFDIFHIQSSSFMLCRGVQGGLSSCTPVSAGAALSC